jgi:hypothetical protein
MNYLFATETEPSFSISHLQVKVYVCVTIKTLNAHFKESQNGWNLRPRFIKLAIIKNSGEGIRTPDTRIMIPLL